MGRVMKAEQTCLRELRPHESTLQLPENIRTTKENNHGKSRYRHGQ